MDEKKLVHEKIKLFLEKSVKPATGCTEPIAVAFGVALAYWALYNDDVKLGSSEEILFNKTPAEFNIKNLISLKIETDINIFKNAYAIVIPGTNGKRGMKIAAAMAFFCDPKKKLNLFNNVNLDIVKKAEEILSKNLISAQLISLNLEEQADCSKIHGNSNIKKKYQKNETKSRTTQELDIRISLKYKINEDIIESFVHIQDSHTNILEIRVDDNLLYQKQNLDIKEISNSQLKNEEKDSNDGNLIGTNLTEILQYSKLLNKEHRDFLLEGVKMNKKVANIGLIENYGLGIGSKLQKIFPIKNFKIFSNEEIGTSTNDNSFGNSKHISFLQKLSNKELISYSKIMAGAAADARMGGAPYPVMSTSGSGNQGIIATLPLAIFAEARNINNERLAQALFISHAITALSAHYSGHLAALCGTDIKAGMGLTAAMVFLLGGNEEDMHAAINLMAGNISGVFCDGAKEGCALKVYNAVETALESAFLALDGVRIPSNNGIVSKTAEETLKAIGKIAHTMAPTDRLLLKIMQDKV